MLLLPTLSEQLMDQIIFEYHDKASTNEGKTELKSAKVFAADCFDASMVLKITTKNNSMLYQ